MSQLASSLSKRPKGTLPSQPLANPKSSSQAYEVQDPQINQYNSGHTLKSGKKVDNQVSKPTNPFQTDPTLASTSASPTQSAPNESDKGTSADQVHKPKAPFSNRIRNNNKSRHMNKNIRDIQSGQINYAFS